MAFMITLSVLLIAGAVVGVTALRRAHRPGRSPGLSDLDAEAEANQWLVRLGGGLVPPGVRVWAGADAETARSLTCAVECHRSARERLATARTAEEYGEATRLAREGLRHLREARTALGIEEEPPTPGSRPRAARRPAGAAAPCRADVPAGAAAP
ncbi:hypothetical protein ACIBBD_07935 [Streptomyces sp. NPDC051315]|uniref:hypothetical protein n=1 Tax=Streptomyces sp. NPDC051315 TaxID=3365650 RepID=UPI0037885FEA